MRNNPGTGRIETGPLPKDKVLFVADAGGCILTHRDDTEFWEYVCSGEKKRIMLTSKIPKPWFISRALRLKKDKEDIEALESKDEAAVYPILSRNLAKMETDRMLWYAHDFSFPRYLDPTFVNIPIVEAMAGSPNLYRSVLSTGIDRILTSFFASVNVDDDGMVNDNSTISFNNFVEEVIANSFTYSDRGDVYEGNITGITLDIFDNKGEVLGNRLEELQVYPDDAFYIGDTERDLECLEMVGYPIISNMASKVFKSLFLGKGYIIGSNISGSTYGTLKDYIARGVEEVLTRRGN